MRAILSFALLALPFAAAKHHSLKKRCSARGQGSNTSKSSLVSAAWYAGWHSGDFPLSAVSWDKYTHLTYSFAYVLFSCVLRTPS